MFRILKRNNGYGMLLQAMVLAVVMSFMAVGAAEARQRRRKRSRARS